jgi:hypothetical protein
MAFDWLGTFNQAQFDRLAKFATDQRKDIQARIQHLEAEVNRVGVLSFSYNTGGIPQGYTVSPTTSYVARLLAAYEVLGGDAFFDLNVRSANQPVFLLRTDETVPAQMLSNGEVLGAPGKADAPSAVYVQQAKAWMQDALDYRREYLERKIRRMLDYVDQLQSEIALLKKIDLGEEIRGSLDSIIKGVQQLIDDPNYRATPKEGDAFNKKGHAPFASYEPGPKGSEAQTFQRGYSGVQEPGSRGGTT